MQSKFVCYQPSGPAASQVQGSRVDHQLLLDCKYLSCRSGAVEVSDMTMSAYLISFTTHFGRLPSCAASFRVLASLAASCSSTWTCPVVAIRSNINHSCVPCALTCLGCAQRPTRTVSASSFVSTPPLSKLERSRMLSQVASEHLFKIKQTFGVFSSEGPVRSFDIISS